MLTHSLNNNQNEMKLLFILAFLKMVVVGGVTDVNSDGISLPDSKKSHTSTEMHASWNIKRKKIFKNFSLQFYGNN